MWDLSLDYGLQFICEVMAPSSLIVSVKRTLTLELIKGRYPKKASRDTVDLKKGKISYKSLIPKSSDIIRELDTI
jgi:hypothetical protein